MAKVKMSFQITWNGSKSAELFYLLDGGVVVSLAGKTTVGSGAITINYLADNTGAHKIEWGLVFPNKTLKTLSASVSISNGPAQDLDDIDSATGVWTGAGLAVG
jgi:hypothetical protein